MLNHMVRRDYSHSVSVLFRWDNYNNCIHKIYLQRREKFINVQRHRNITKMSSPNDSVVICGEKKVTPRRYSRRLATQKAKGGQVFNWASNGSSKSRVPLRTVYESPKKNCPSVSKPNIRTPKVEVITSRKRRRTIDLCETITISSGEEDDNDTNIDDVEPHQFYSRVKSSGQSSQESVVILDLVSQKYEEGTSNDHSRKKKRFNKTEKKKKKTKKGFKHNRKNPNAVSAAWSLSNKQSSSKADPVPKVTDKPMFFFDTEGDMSNLDKFKHDSNDVIPDKNHLKTVPKHSRGEKGKRANRTERSETTNCSASTDPENVKKDDKDDCDKDRVQNRKLREIVVDGLNVAYGHSRDKSIFSKEGLELVLNYFRERGHQVKIFIPQHERSRIRQFLEDWYLEGFVVFTPSRHIAGKKIASHDDRFILAYATKCEGIVVSRDQYRDLWEEKPEWRDTIENRLLAFTFVGDFVMFPEDPLGRRGPKLDEFLRH